MYAEIYNEQINNEPGNYGAGFLGLRQGQKQGQFFRMKVGGLGLRVEVEGILGLTVRASSWI